jgi:hypothetical protein
MKRELRMMGKEAVATYFKNSPSMCLECLRKATENFGPENLSPGRNFVLGAPE